MTPGVLFALALLIAGCDGQGTAPPPPPGAGRVQAVAAKQIGADELAGFCDVHAAPGSGKPLAVPPTDRPLSSAGGKPRWINLWATWCKPCIEEMPMIERWRDELQAQGVAPVVDFISVDEDEQTVVTFRKEHPGTPESRRLSGADALAGFLGQLGLDPGAGLPVHIFTGSDHKTRCVRAGAVTASHYELVSVLLR
jgi:thiol-disulfide isomerase/thioredoxin